MEAEKTIQGVLKTLPPEQLAQLARLNERELYNVMHPVGRKVSKKGGKRPSLKGVKKTSDYIDFDSAMRKGQDLLWSGKKVIPGFYIIFSINIGCRVSDVMDIKHSDLEGKKTGDSILIVEQKTGKERELTLNAAVVEAYSYMREYLRHRRILRPDDYIFKSQKNHVFATSTLNRMLKREFAGYAKNVSTHSLRKTFGRRVYNNHGKSEAALHSLGEVFRHTNIAVTRRYLGISEEEIANIYLNL